MNSKILLIALAASILLISCSSSKRMAQTVDDLYYSPTTEYVKQQEKERNEKEMEEQREENFLRNKVRNRNRWQRIDDFSYWNDTRYNFNHCGCNNNFTNWNTYYNGWANPYTNFWVGGCGNTWNNPFFTFVPYVAPTIRPTNNWATIKSFNNNNFNNNNVMTFNPKTGFNNNNNNNNNTATSNPRTSRPNNNGGFFNNAIRVFSGSSAPSSNAGGRSGGFNSSGSSSGSTPRAGRTRN